MCMYTCWEDKQFQEISAEFQFEKYLNSLIYLFGGGKLGKGRVGRNDLPPPLPSS